MKTALRILGGAFAELVVILVVLATLGTLFLRAIEMGAK
jgi:hypothetical protein